MKLIKVEVEESKRSAVNGEKENYPLRFEWLIGWAGYTPIKYYAVVSLDGIIDNLAYTNAVVASAFNHAEAYANANLFTFVGYETWIKRLKDLAKISAKIKEIYSNEEVNLINTYTYGIMVGE